MWSISFYNEFIHKEVEQMNIEFMIVLLFGNITCAIFNFFGAKNVINKLRIFNGIALAINIAAIILLTGNLILELIK
jgi:uncharacterized membrane protein